MRVFIVMKLWYSNNQIVGVRDTYEKAEKLVEEQGKGSYEIEEWYVQ